MTTENSIARDRLAEIREIIKIYDSSTLKWINICRESEITSHDINQRSTTVNNSLNIEKQD